MDFLEKELDCLYRVDKYIVGDMKKGGTDVIKEYFMVAGDNSIICLYNDMPCSCVVSTFGKIFELRNFNIEYAEELADYVNCLRELMMYYDYAVTELRKISEEEALKSHLNDIKVKIENAIRTGDFNFDMDEDFEEISDDEYDEMFDRCDYLAHAYNLEWRGVISRATCRKFDNIEDLDEYVEKKKFFKNPQDKDKTIERSILTKISPDEDPLAKVRNLYVDSVKRYVPRLKNSKLLKQKLLDDENQLWEYYDKLGEIQLKILQAKTKEEVRNLSRSGINLTKKFNKKRVHVPFIQPELEF